MRLVVSCLLMLAAATTTGATPDLHQREVVARLYHDFAWEAVVVTNETGLAEQPKDVLLRYFTPGLAGLLVEDARCKARRREICRLDFTPLWASQDPAAEGLTIVQASGDTVGVQYVVPSTREHVSLVFHVVKTAAGWRVGDITYPQGSSLAGLLSAPMD
ncbi:hypothetical protein [Pseudoxanthomonas sp. JBR18]|uniref:hypothetical protein n=1 Tax=Pseudoxanthomonas sp. JBR18 TaxID=2969308 RepID=UPI002306CD76|nr:hypothetical protein [Pseudoxanthomonas sp. JBR18]WCE06165.1 hypothetical protein PJ250_09555 [Pseudoxanthomonas sp. JBR18]